MARWEYSNLPTILSKTAPESPWKLHGLMLWVFLIFQIIAYPILALIIERVLYGTASKQHILQSDYDPTGPTVRLRGFSKLYRQHWFPRLFWKRKAVVNAVKELALDSHKGQILMLLGPNGSGMSTTLDAIAGLSKVSSGRIDIDGTGGLRITPLKNVLWDELTVEEHVRALYNLKSANTRHTSQELATLINACDLACKKMAKLKTLSGGQKRKLQLAMMFAGGSSGWDPLSRRTIWNILLAERGDRTIIMTTHFLDEADFLSDRIAILSAGHLKAEGSSAALKHQYGEGYSIHVPVGVSAPYIHNVKRTESLDGTVYTAQDPVNTSHIVDALERAGVDDFWISDPTLEDWFEKMECSIPSDDAYTYRYSSYTESLANDYGLSLVGGPSERITDQSLASLGDIYLRNHTRYGSGSIYDPSSLQEAIAKASTYQDFAQQFELGNATIAPSGFWLGDGSTKPTFAWSVDPYGFVEGLKVQNVLNNMLMDGRITTSFENF
ncbi:MAG: hypothetical protein Q9166_005699 [cf. Caloplaca sp. 2 TL-2023]